MWNFQRYFHFLSTIWNFRIIRCVKDKTYYEMASILVLWGAFWTTLFQREKVKNATFCGCILTPTAECLLLPSTKNLNYYTYHFHGFVFDQFLTIYYSIFSFLIIINTRVSGHFRNPNTGLFYFYQGKTFSGQPKFKIIKPCFISSLLSTSSL